MVLRMACPTKRLGSNNWYYRRTIPKDVQALLQKPWPMRLTLSKVFRNFWPRFPLAEVSACQQITSLIFYSRRTCVASSSTRTGLMD